MNPIEKLALLALSLPLAVFGYDGTWTKDGVTFSYTVSTVAEYEVSVSITSCGDSAEVEIPSEIDGYKVTSIGMTSSDCRAKLASVVMPDSVTRIGNSAFYDCTNLKSVTIPRSVTDLDNFAFEGCRGLTSVTIPDGVTCIDVSAFEACSGLTSVTIPDGVTSIDPSAFYECSSLTSVTIPDSVKVIGWGAFIRCNLSEVSIPADATINSYSFDSGVKVVRRPSIAYANLKGATNTNPATYEEGKALALAAPGAVSGYTFAGWTPSAITADMTGAQTVTANWTANRYQIVYKANGASGATAATDCEYDAEGEIAANAFTYAGYVFKGWATEEGGAVVYAPGDRVTNLTTKAGGVVMLYAVWEAEAPTPLTWTGVLDEDKLGAVATGGDAEWQMEEADGAEASATPKVGDSFAVSGAIDEGDETERTSWLKVTVNGRGTLSFWWKVDCEPDPRGRFTYDYGKVETNGTLVVCKDGTTDWMQQTVTFDTDGEHEIVLTYVADGYIATSGNYAGRMWLDGLSWSGAAVPDVPVVPSVLDDSSATVTGDAETGFVVTPSEDATEVVVTIPDGVDAAKVTVKVSPEMQRVTPNGAAVKVVRGEADITDFLNIPTADASGVIDLTAAMVKEEIAKEPLDAEKGAKVDFASPSKPSLTTAPTQEGLVYRLKEGATLEAMAADTKGATKIGDGTSWTPTLSVTGGTSGFYTIEVGK